MAHDVTLILGDGVGPELAEAARMCVDATGVKISWDPQEAGIDVMQRTGTPLPEPLLASIRRTRCALKAPITTPVGKGFRSVNVQLRMEFELYACVRPCKYYPGVRTFFSGVPVDLVIVRENTEDLYAGIEFEAGAAKTGELIDYINRASTDKQIKTPEQRDRHLDQADQHPRHRADRALRLRIRPGQRPQEGHGGAQGQHHEAHRRPVSGHRPQGGRGVPGHRVRGPHRRQYVHAVGAEAGTIRRARAAQPVRRHPQRPGRRPGGRTGGRPGGEYRRQRGHFRGHPRQCPEI